jgi:hypothetical protein
MATSVFSQTNLNSYKYIIVAEKFDFLKESNQYRLNELAEFLFEKYGFEAVIEGEDYPNDLLMNRCSGLKANVLKDSGMFKTRLTVQLKDCNDRIIYTSEVGESREKEFERAYSDALRNAFNSIQALEYKYEPSNTDDIAVLQEVETKSEVAKEIQELKEEIQNLKKEKEIVAVEKIEQKVEPVTPIPVKVIEVEEGVTVKAPAVKEASINVLYAQAIENGFQLVDSTPKVVYKIKRTGIQDVYLIEGKNATLYKKGADWIIEYYENDILKQEVLNIKF